MNTKTGEVVSENIFLQFLCHSLNFDNTRSDNSSIAVLRNRIKNRMGHDSLPHLFIPGEYL
jgi:hypothetical protein